MPGILLLLAAVAVVSVVSIFPTSDPTVPQFFPLPSLDLPPAPIPPPLPSLGILRPADPPLTPSLLDLSANIALKDKDVRNQTGRYEARRSTAGGSAPYGKYPNRPLAVVWDSIIRSLFLHRPQKYNPVHFWLAFRHSHALANGSMVEQVKCRVQMQHLLTGS